VDIGRALTFFRADPYWVQRVTLLSVLHLCLLFPILGWPFAFVIAGYLVDVTRHTYDGVDIPLPEWRQMGSLFMRGVVLNIGLLIWLIPLSIPGLLAIVLAGADTTSTRVVVALSVLTAVCVLVAMPIVPTVIARFARERHFGSMFAFSGILQDVRAAPLNLFAVAVVITGIYGVAVLVGIALCLFGIFVTIPWASLAAAHLIGQAYRKARRVDHFLAPTT
jgi:hypothetical protein